MNSHIRRSGCNGRCSWSHGKGSGTIRGSEGRKGLGEGKPLANHDSIACVQLIDGVVYDWLLTTWCFMHRVHPRTVLANHTVLRISISLTDSNLFIEFLVFIRFYKIPNRNLVTKSEKKEKRKKVGPSVTSRFSHRFFFFANTTVIEISHGQTLQVAVERTSGRVQLALVWNEENYRAATPKLQLFAKELRSSDPELFHSIWANFRYYYCYYYSSSSMSIRHLRLITQTRSQTKIFVGTLVPIWITTDHKSLLWQQARSAFNGCSVSLTPKLKSAVKVCLFLLFFLSQGYHVSLFLRLNADFWIVHISMKMAPRTYLFGTEHGKWQS